VPTFAQAGIKGYSADAWYGLLAPAATAPETLAVLRRVATEFAQAPATRDKLKALGMEPRHTCGDAFNNQLVDEVKAYRDLARALDLKVE
jgi:tripartite-type tricarboxylate transporter receptor subunit TctC